MEEKVRKKPGPKSTIEEKFNNGLFPSKEELEQYYIQENHTKAECLSYFNLTVKEWQKIITRYQISKINKSKYSGKQLLDSIFRINLLQKKRFH